MTASDENHGARTNQGFPEQWLRDAIDCLVSLTRTQFRDRRVDEYASVDGTVGTLVVAPTVGVPWTLTGLVVVSPGVNGTITIGHNRVVPLPGSGLFTFPGLSIPMLGSDVLTLSWPAANGTAYVEAMGVELPRPGDTVRPSLTQ